MVETVANTAVGYSINLVAQITVYPMFGFRPTIGQNLTLGLIFTIISIVRGYVMRRVFNRWHIYLESK